MALQKDKVRFYAKKPGAGRAKFSILKDVLKPDGRRVQELVKDERIDAVNRAFKNGIRDLTTCELEIEQIIESLYKPHKLAPPAFTEANLKLMEAYWEAEYTHRNLADPTSARNDLLRAIEAVGTLSIISASRDELQKQVNKRHRGNKQRRVVARLNQLLKFAKRPFKLSRDKKEKRRIKFLSEAEFQRVLAHVSDPVEKMVLSVCFAIGCRIGEAFALRPEDVREGVVHIDKQMKRNLTITERKRGGECFTVPLPLGTKSLTDWAHFKDKETYRNKDWPEITRRACHAAFPNNKEKWISTHGLRHSYAICLLSKGVSLSLVAQSLGDSIAVAEEHYAGFVLAPDSIEAIKSALRNKLHKAKA